MLMNDFLTGILSGDLSRLSIVNDNAKVSRASRMKACSSFGTLDEVRKDEVRKDRWSRLTRQEKDSSLMLKTKRPRLLSSASLASCLGERSRVSSESSITCPKRTMSPTRETNNSSNATWGNEDISRLKKNKAAVRKTKRPPFSSSSSSSCLIGERSRTRVSRVSSTSSLTCPKRLISPIRESNNLNNARWDNEDIAGREKLKAADSMLCFSSCPKRIESPVSQRNNGKNATWDNEDADRLQNKKPTDAMLSLLDLKGSALSSSSRQEDGSGIGMFMSRWSSHNNVRVGVTRSSSRSSQYNIGSGMSVSRSNNDNMGGMARSSSRSSKNDFGSDVSMSKSNNDNMGGMTRSSSRSSKADIGSAVSMSKSNNDNMGGMTRSSSRSSKNDIYESSHKTVDGITRSSTKTKSLRSALGSMAPTPTMKRSFQKAPKPSESRDGNATFKSYRVPSKSSLLYSPPGATSMKMNAMPHTRSLLDSAIAILPNHY